MKSPFFTSTKKEIHRMKLTGRIPILVLVVIFLQIFCIESQAEPNRGVGCVRSKAAGHLHGNGARVCDQSPVIDFSRQYSQTSAVPLAKANCSRAVAVPRRGSCSGCRQGASAKHQLHLAGKNTLNFVEKTENEKLISPLHHRWFHALLSTLLISLAPFLVIFWIPINANDDQNQPLLRILLSFVSGGLLGDAFLHLIPHAISPSRQNSKLEYTIFGLWILAGFLGFLIVEKVVRNLKNEQISCQTEEFTPVKAEKLKASKEFGEEKTTEEEVARKLTSDDTEQCARKEEDFQILSQLEEKNEVSPTEVEKTTTPKKLVVTPARPARSERWSENQKSTKSGDIRVSGYLNLAADFAHNFTDGLAIGASFLAGHGIGWVTSVAILCHELPHEIGDFALLIRSGCSKPKAIALQFVTTVGAFAGCLVSLVFGSTDTDSKSSSVMGFTAGGFIYIATVSIIPELLADVKIWQSVKEILSLLAGIGLMAIITLCE